MIYHEKDMEERAVLDAAMKMCVAARTAPKTAGIDHIATMVLTGAEKDELADRLDKMGEEQSIAFYRRDAGNLRKAQAVVLIGVKEGTRGLDQGCRYCRFKGCVDCSEAGGVCIFDPLDLGIAIGSAVSLAADLRIDNRVMYSAGKAALDLKLMGEEADIVMAIPLSALGKSPFFDRK